eukprot:TRINITY_DN1895_c0_g1_i4.p1 TRINITY_DN1895_c0_g1~~TRINITY_DN1895_c0_g1_i4.p1  ORF type:complete len:118 (-),score=17.70 TRINITY_DN1895_c0_g1_i4:336-689(-)
MFGKIARASRNFVGLRSMVLGASRTAGSSGVMRWSGVRYFSQEKDGGSHPDFQPKVKESFESADEAEVLQKIDQWVKGNRVVLFMKGTPQMPNCGYSNFAVEVLKFYSKNASKSVCK